MIYLEHQLLEGGVRSLSSAVILAPADTGSVSADLAAEILQLYPRAEVRILRPGEAVPPCDLLVAIFDSPARFPLHDPVYDDLDKLVDVERHASGASSVMIYAAQWRGMEVFPSAALPGYVRRRRAEGRLIRLLKRSRLLRRMLRPLYT